MTRFLVLLVGLALGPSLLAASEKTTVDPDKPRELTLSACLDIATQSNPNLLEASTGFKDAEGQSIRLHAILYPRVATAALSLPPTMYVQVDQFVYNRAIDPQIKLSHLTREQAVLNYQQVLSEVIYRVRQNFATALALQTNLQSLQDYLDHSQKTLESSGPLFDAGQINKADVLRLKVKNNLTRQRAEAARSSYRQSLLALELVLGEKLGDTVHLNGSLELKNVPELDVKKLTEQALRERPDLKMLENLKLVESQKIAISTQAFYPTLGLSSDSAYQAPSPIGGGGYDINRNFDDPASQRVNGNSQLPLSVYLNWTFFDGGKTWGEKISGEAQITSRKEALTALKNSIPGEIKQAVETLQNAQLALKAIAEAPTAEQLRTNADLDFKAGKIRLLDKDQVEDAIFDQEKASLDARLNASLAAAALDHALRHVVQFAPGKTP